MTRRTYRLRPTFRKLPAIPQTTVLYPRSGGADALMQIDIASPAIRARGWNLRAGADGATTGFDADVVAPIDKIRCLVLQVLVAGRCAEPPPTATHPPTSWTAVRAYKAVAAASAARRNFVFEQQQAGRE